MGEAKRKRLAPCRCNSGIAAGQCCLGNNGWHKLPVAVDLRNTGSTGAHASCYLHSTNACGTKISSEHLVSHGVLKVLAEKQVEVSGMPWLRGEKKVLGFGAFTTNCLCKDHNSALSPIDAAGACFFEAIQRCGTNDTGPTQHFLLSGYDVERWMLRTLAAFGHSKNLGIDGARIDDEFIDRLQFGELLEDPTKWKRPMGIYLTQGLNHRFTRRDNFQMSPLLTRGSDEVVGMLFDIQGFNLALLAADHEVEGSFLQNTSYRPGSFIFKMGRFTHDIMLSWEDNIQHANVTLTWEP